MFKTRTLSQIQNLKRLLNYNRINENLLRRFRTNVVWRLCLKDQNIFVIAYAYLTVYGQWEK